MSSLSAASFRHLSGKIAAKSQSFFAFVVIMVTSVGTLLTLLATQTYKIMQMPVHGRLLLYRSSTQKKTWLAKLAAYRKDK